MHWEITAQSSVFENLSELSQELQKVWKEICRVFVLSLIVRPKGAYIEFHVEGLGYLVLSWVIGPISSHVPLLANLTMLQTVTLSSMV